MSDSNLLDRMRQEWNERAREDAHYYVAFSRREQDDAEFLATAAEVVIGLRNARKRLRLPGQPLPPGLKALEIGCGPGRLMRHLSRDFAEIHGIDVSDEMIRLAAEKLRDVSNAHLYHAEKSDLSIFPDESFDFVYSYAVFQHIPSRDVVLGYLTEARRVLKPGGILVYQVNGLPQAAVQHDTWEGVRFTAQEIADFALHHDFQLLALERVLTQYMWTTWRKQPPGWRAALRPQPHPATRIRAITNALTGDLLVPVTGARAFASLWIENLPADCDLLNLEVRIGGRPAVLTCISPPEWDYLLQVNAGLPAGTRTGLIPVEISWLGEPLTPPAWMRVIPAGPAVPRVTAARQLSGRHLDGRCIRVVMEEVSNPEQLAAAVDDLPVARLEMLCGDPLEQRYEINLFLPEAIQPGPHQVHLRLGRRALAPVAIEVA